MKFSMVIPVYNESSCITDVVSEILTAFERLKIHPAEVIVVDDGSTDNTPDILLRLVEENKRVRVITHSTNKGIGAANRTGFTAAEGEWVGWVPGDGQFHPEEVLNLYLQNRSADLIVTSVEPLKRLQTDSFFRLFISKSLRFLTRLIANADGKMTGVFLFKRKTVQGTVSNMTTGLFNITFPIVAQKRNCRIVYAGISIRPRMAGSSKVMNVTTILRTLYELLEFRFKNYRSGDKS